MTRKIQDITPWLGYYFMDIEIEPSSFEHNKKLLNDNIPRLGQYYKYFGLLHDSWIINTNIDSDRFSITLNDFTTHVFSDAIIDKKKLKINHDKLVFPIKIEFEISNITYNTVDEEGNIRPVEKSNINEYLYEQIISVDNDKIEIALIVWKDGIDDERGQEILILVSAKSIILTEFQDNAWIEIFGNSYDDYYKYFKSELANDRFLSDYSKCVELVEEYDRNRI